MSVPEDADGLVLRVDRASALVEIGTGGRADAVRVSWGGPMLAAVAADPEAAPCTGDRVTWRRWPDGRLTIEAVHPRRTLLARGAPSGTSARQLLAANVDLVAVVEGLMPDPDARRLARMLTLAWSSGAEPVVLLTKADLVPDAPRLAAETAASAMCRVFAVSAVTGEGVDDVRALLAPRGCQGEGEREGRGEEGRGDGTGRGRVMALLGASGAGKSSLVNALAGGDVMSVGALRNDGKGRHTTVTRELHHVAGGAVIDGPGLRAVGLADADGLDLTFADVLQWAAQCHFADCTHVREPGCAVLGAVERGELEGDRLDAWHQLVAEGRRQELRRDARLRAEDRRRGRVQARALRRDRPWRP